MLISPRPRTPPATRQLADQLAGRLTFQGNPPRYRDTATGRYVPPAVVRTVIDDEITATSERLKEHGRALQRGDIDLNQWRDNMAADLKLLHIASYSAARGGFAQLTPDDYKAISKVVRRQHKYLERFAAQLDKDPTQAAGDGFLSRSQLYAEAARESYEESRRQQHIALGFTKENNVLHARESCTARGGRPGCVELTGRGVVPIGTLPAVGRRACFARCKCTLEYS